MPTNPFPHELPPAKAEEIAARRTARLKTDAGLFADLVPPVTPGDVQQGVREHSEKFQATHDRLTARAAQFRGRVAALVPARDLAVLDERLKLLPPTPEYAADFWRRWLRRLEADPLAAGDLD